MNKVPSLGWVTLTAAQPAVLIMNKVSSPWPQSKMQDTLQHSVNKVPSPWPQPSTRDTLKYTQWTRFPHPDHSPASGTPCSTHSEQGSLTLTTAWHPAHPAVLTLTTPKHLGHPEVLTVNKVPPPWPHHSEQGSLTLTTPQHLGHAEVLTVNKVPSPWPHPRTWDTQKYSQWTRFPHPDHTPARGTPCSVVEAAYSSRRTRCAVRSPAAWASRTLTCRRRERTCARATDRLSVKPEKKCEASNSKNGFSVTLVEILVLNLSIGLMN